MKQKQMVALLLSAVLLLSTVPTGALAAELQGETAASAVQTETQDSQAVATDLDDEDEANSQEEASVPAALHLTDLDWQSAKVGWGSIHKNENISGSTIRLLVDGTVQSFEKGIGAHATSQVIYKISDYDYDTLQVYAGVDYSQGSMGNGVVCSVYTSVDGAAWTQQAVSGVLKGNTEAQRFIVDVSGANYIKLYADDNGANGNDHACWGDPVLYNASSLTVETEHGTVTLSDDTPIPGETVTVTTQADRGYLLMSLYVVTDSGTTTDITETKSFEMPDENATVVALYQEGQLDRMSLLELSYEKDLTTGYPRLNQSHEGKAIELYVDGVVTTFSQGLGAHANTTFVYDLTGYDYKWFETYAGVHYSKANQGDGVKFYVYTSTDGVKWELVASTGVLMGQDDAQFVRAYIGGAKYLKLVTDKNGNNSYDHACWGDPTLVAEDTSNVSVEINTVAEYDAQIQAQYPSVDENLLHTRDFVSAVGYAGLQNFVRQSEENANAVEWLMGNETALSYYMLGGQPEGTYYNSLVQLSRLYAAYADDMDNDLYLRMVIALALSHATATGLWADPTDESNISDPVTRYAIYKTMYEAGDLDGMFADNNVEEMRWVMNSIIDDESIQWLHDYTEAKKEAGVSAYMNPYTYIAYRWYNYSDSQYHDGANYDTWDAKYHLSQYGITYGDVIKTWIVFEEGAVCGGISKTGTAIRNVYGIPATCTSQPGHCAYTYQVLNADGNRYWVLGNDVSGWAYSGRTERLNYRMVCDWGDRSDFSWQHPMTYLFLAQEAINDWDSYAQAETILMLADVYADDSHKLEEIYEMALASENINYDAWYGLVKLYIAEGRSDEELLALANRIAAAYTYHPMPMNDLVTLLTNAMTEVGSQVAADVLRTKTLTTASKATSADSLQYAGVQAEAKRLLSQDAGTTAEFSFTGDNANLLMLGSKYTGSEVAWDYSLDGETWITATGDSVELNPDDITPENGIRVHIIGTAYTEENIVVISITQAGQVTNYANIWEGKLMGTVTNVEYQVAGDDTWQDYEDGLTFGITRSQTVSFRVKASGTQKAGEPTVVEFPEHNFAAGIYLSIDHITADPWPVNDGKICSYSTFRTQAVLTLDDTYLVSGGWYVADQTNNYGRVKSLSAYTSLDGENWTLVLDSLILPNTNEPQELVFDTVTEAKYVKYVANSVYSGAARAEMFMVAYREPVPVEEITLTAENLSLTGHEDGSENLVIPSLIEGDGVNYQVTAVDDCALMMMDGLKTVTFEDGISAIGTGALMYNSDLETVTMPEGLTEIADYLFFEDSSLTTVTIPGTVTAIGDSAFHMCTSLQSVTYNGTQEAWQQIALGENNDLLEQVVIHCTDGDITPEGTVSYEGTLASYESGILTLDSRFEGVEVTSQYSMDGGTTWLPITGLSQPVDPNALTAENGILVSVDGHEYFIALTQQAAPQGLTTSDLENRVYGLALGMEFSTDGGSSWTTVTEDTDVRFEGDCTVLVRTCQQGTALASEALTFPFTDNGDTPQRKYVSMEDLSVIYASTVTMDRGNAAYVNDGNKNTFWICGSKDAEKALVYELSQVKTLTGASMVSHTATYYNPASVTVYVSLDNENWTKVATSTVAWSSGQTTTQLSFDGVEAKYVKFVLSGNPLMKLSGVAMLSLYEDTTVSR
jgi:hypothetical protein